MRFVSGGDDCTVRLWSIRDEAPTAVIDAKANVCSVQFSPVSSNLLAFGSANYRVYLYDLRQMQVHSPDCIAVGCLKSAQGGALSCLVVSDVAPCLLLLAPCPSCRRLPVL